MAVTDILVSQATDPFRLGLLLMLVVMAARTAPTLGYFRPLALGAVFVGVLIPLAFAPDDPDFITRISVGIIVNAVILGLMMAAKAMFTRLRAGG